MGRASYDQHAVNAGELSPLMLGRQDVGKYAHGLYVCYNALPLVQGGWTRRPGTLFLTQTKYHDKLARLIRFEYSTTQTYVLEFGDQYVRFLTNHGILTNAAQSITTVSQANPGVVAKIGHGYSNGTRLLLSVPTGMTQLHGREVQVAGATPNTFTLQDSDGNAIDTTAYGAFTAGTMASIYEVATPYTEAQLSSLRVTQSADTLYLTHVSHAPRALVRTSALSWSLSTLVFTDGPYLNQNATATTLTPSATSGTGVTITASSADGINGTSGFHTTDVGRLVRLRQGSTWGTAVITARPGATQITVTVIDPFASTAATGDWRLGLWSDTTGYPAVSTFFEDRLCFAGVPAAPQRVDMSKTGAYQHFGPSALNGTIADDNAVSVTLNSDDVNVIRWLAASERGLLAGTARSEWVLRANTQGDAITPTNRTARQTTRHGSAQTEPVRSGRTVLFVQRAGRKLREMAYVFEADGHRAPDLTLLSEHVTRGGIRELAYVEQPQAIVWSAREDGVLLGMTYERDQDVVAWHRHELGGSSDGADAIPVVESVAAVPAPDGATDELYMIVQRYINGATRRYIEMLTPLWDDGDAQEDAFFLDCGLTSIASPASATITGLWHLEGETVRVLTDGTAHPPVTVTNGTVALDYAASVRTIGYTYESDGQTLPIEAGAQDGSAQAKRKRIAKVGFWLLDTLGLKYGPDANSLTELVVRTYGEDFGAATPLFTGVVRERFEGDWNLLGQVYWRADGPFPATVLSVMPQVHTTDDS